MRIGIGNDHAAVELKNEIIKHLTNKGYEVINFGINEGETVDYPEIGEEVGRAIVDNIVDYGVLICGTGFGISLAANKINGIRACVCSEPVTASLSKRHNNANIIAFGARIVGLEMAKAIVDSFFDAEFEGGRHQRRVNLLTDIEEKVKAEE